MDEAIGKAVCIDGVKVGYCTSLGATQEYGGTVRLTVEVVMPPDVQANVEDYLYMRSIIRD